MDIWRKRAAALRKGERMLPTFEVIITSNQNYTWQGEVKTRDGSFPFQSELELLKIIFALRNAPISPDTHGKRRGTG